MYNNNIKYGDNCFWQGKIVVLVDSYFYRDLEGFRVRKIWCISVEWSTTEIIRNNNLLGREFLTSCQVAKMDIILTSVVNVVTVAERRTDNAIAQRESSIKVYEQDSKLLKSVVN